VDRAVICQLNLDEAKVKQFKDAIENSYWLEFFVGMFFSVYLLMFY
jgi:transmembrane 9 superfamily protein 3